ncbi:MAG TPA: CHAT domain-containing protein, partial [Longimicrobiales bacterium]
RIPDLWDPCAAPSGGEVWLRLPPMLAGVPFSALVDDGGRYLIETHAIARVGPLLASARSWEDRLPGPALAFGNPSYNAFPGFTSPSIWTAPPEASRDRGPGMSRCLVPGRMLHGTHVELTLLTQAFGAHGISLRLLEWDSAYESALREVPVDLRILHFATHAYAMDAACFPEVPTDPFHRVGLQLSGISRARPEDLRREDDGLLSGSEISRLPLGSLSLVAFSGCATATGDEVGGEGPMGLTAAAWVSGAPRTLATLWNVDDESMPRDVNDFYTAWLAGAAPAHALRSALLGALGRARAERGHAHPRWWAAFVLEGP